ncbi:actin nucleation-promoting factor WAS-like [Rhynchophorus ferrugineus]|uniref:actin nucleation-promoting factor WAS-like n=1 Tax=Rhynchophorus ferrugineus TaxID=354439 RepID=UPI003FCDCA19
MKMPPTMDNQNSNLLSTDENLQVFRLLGTRCQTLATTVVQLFVTTPPNHSQWNKKDTGVLCFVKDNTKKNFFFRLYNLKKNILTWEHEMYNNMEYIESMPFFHLFEGEECIVAFNFANQGEAKHFKNTVEQKISFKKRKEEKRVRQQSQYSHVPQRQVDFQSKQEIRREKSKARITKADIGVPMDFVHVSHVGWDPASGFDIDSKDDNLREIFNQAGISEKQLQDKDTRDFIYDFIHKHGGIDAEINPPVVPPRGPARPPSGRPAPPPPPFGRPPQNNGVQRKPPPPSPPKSTGPAPPPPPPPPPMNIPAPPPMLDNDLPPIVTNDAESALFESIRNGTNLKPVEERRVTPMEDPRGDLLSEIRKGIQLKKVDERELKPSQNSPTQTTGNDLARALAKALAERSKVIHSEDDDDDTSSTSNDDDWD